MKPPFRASFAVGESPKPYVIGASVAALLGVVVLILVLSSAEGGSRPRNHPGAPVQVSALNRTIGELTKQFSSWRLPSERELISELQARGAKVSQTNVPAGGLLVRVLSPHAAMLCQASSRESFTCSALTLPSGLQSVAVASTVQAAQQSAAAELPSIEQRNRTFQLANRPVVRARGSIVPPSRRK